MLYGLIQSGKCTRFVSEPYIAYTCLGTSFIIITEFVGFFCRTSHKIHRERGRERLLSLMNVQYISS